MDYAGLGKRIKAKRIEFGLTQQELADKLEISSYFLGQIERAEGKVGLGTLVKFANFFNTTTDMLLQDSILCKDVLNSEINKQLTSLSEKDKLFILDVIKSYKSYK